MISLFHKYRSELLLFALIAQIVASPLADSRPLIGAVAWRYSHWLYC